MFGVTCSSKPAVLTQVFKTAKQEQSSKSAQEKSGKQESGLNSALINAAMSKKFCYVEGTLIILET